ncbi:MAG: SRPBCC family protein [Verrucomicrobiota bacterium]
MSAQPDQIERSTKLAAPVSRVWRALTDFEEFGEWFRVKLDGPFVVGQASTGHITHPGYEHLKWEAVVQRIEAESLFSFTWHPYAVDPTVDYSGETPTLVTFRLEPAGGGCRLTVTESGFDQIPPHRRAEAFRMNDGGWAIQMENIARHVGEARD